MENKIGVIYKTAYEPLLSKETKKIIKKHVSPVMGNKSTSQYTLNLVLALKTEFNIMEDDLKLLEYMNDEKNIAYIEF